MALTKCKECGAEISTKALACPKCGAKIVKTSGCAKFALALIVLFVAIGFFASQRAPRSVPSGDQSNKGIGGSEVSASAGWRYRTLPDKINNKVSVFQELESRNSIDYGFPYGTQKMQLTVRKAPSDGTSVYVSLQKGQLICDISRGCNVKVRFDDAPAVTFTGRAPADYSSDTLFLTPAERFIGDLKKSKAAVIEVVFYQHGAVQYEFNTEGFKSP